MKKKEKKKKKTKKRKRMRTKFVNWQSASGTKFKYAIGWTWFQSWMIMIMIIVIIIPKTDMTASEVLVTTHMLTSINHPCFDINVKPFNSRDIIFFWRWLIFSRANGTKACHIHKLPILFLKCVWLVAVFVRLNICERRMIKKNQQQ